MVGEYRDPVVATSRPETTERLRRRPEGSQKRSAAASVSSQRVLIDHGASDESLSLDSRPTKAIHGSSAEDPTEVNHGNAKKGPPRSSLHVRIRLAMRSIKNFLIETENSSPRVQSFHFFSTLLFFVAVALWLVQQGRRQHYAGPRSGATAENGPTKYSRLPSFKAPLKGIRHSVRFPNDVILSETADFGDISIRLIAGPYFHRQIFIDPGMNQGDVVYYDPEFYDSGQDFDDDAIHLAHTLSIDVAEDELPARQCRRTEIERNHFPNCNTFHEFDRTASLTQGISTIVGLGESHYVFGVNETNSGMFVCKTPFCTQNADDFDLHDYEEMRYDAVIFESFSSDKYFVDLYGHCGLSVFAEYMPYGDIDVVATPIFNTDRYGGNNFTDEEMLQMNQLEPEFKLRVAIEMTEAVEHLHNFESGRIVHGDLHLVQFLFTKEGKEDWKNARQVLKISDFNMALFLPYNEVEGEYCKVYSGVGGGDWRSPQEYKGEAVDEKMDIFALGLAIFALLTGVVPFPEDESFTSVAERFMDGEIPFIDPRIRERSSIEDQLAEIAEECWAYEPEDRPTALELLESLREIEKATV